MTSLYWFTIHNAQIVSGQNSFMPNLPEIIISHFELQIQFTLIPT